ncbi:uncharacterized protein P884DRAFT_271522 [Thermothelomyces heterothallicus CBS 202.75]|uniref:uncharacterized protein n=1 Tax=Thermothelomyces heterothallicus CBS 202.75 TaxID=1149848 RepID=UPI0037449D0B
MSNPPFAPENTAAADAAAVSPIRSAETGDAAPSPSSPSGTQTQTPPPSWLPGTAAQEEGSVSSVPPPPPSPPSPLPPSQSPPAVQRDTAGAVPLAAQATGASATAHADPVKHARGPVALQRPHGPSLLTQALATARGIPRQTQCDPSHPQKAHPSQHPQNHSEPQELHNKDTDSRNTRHGSRPQGDGDSLTPRLSPRKTAMPSSSTATSTAVAPPVFGRLDLAEVNSMLSGHRDFLNKTKAKVGPLESSERERPARWDGYSNDKTATSAHHHTSVHPTDPPAAVHHVADAENGVVDGRPQLRPWKTEHRVSMGPEKVWSIGAGDEGGVQDGQVEKSISEVLAGVEHNNRSRKASHSLRFFKEGLPEEKGKRKDQRSSHSTRDRSPSRGEKLADIQEQPVGGESADAQALGDAASISEPHKRMPESKAAQGSPRDHAVPQHGEPAQGPAAPTAAAVVAEPVPSEYELGGQEQHGTDSADPSQQSKPRPESDLGNGAGESVEEGEESGEEKISSAVFLPHQAPGESPESSPVPGMPQRMVPSRRHSRHGDFHPWLVKADEPEIDDEQKSLNNFEGEVGLEAAEYSSVAPEVAYRQAEDSGPVAQREPAVHSSRLSRPVSHYHEDAVHEHQWTPKQPLEAIELIPYKHQVGGHTTLWRFSRRAVCKQLNNRENEFYEKIEKYHRDLLAFLPRYIGVLNVTFQKQPRRKSTMKREDGGAVERSRTAPNGSPAGAENGTAQDETAQQTSETPRVVSQSMKQVTGQVPTVTFVDNQHILPRSLLQPAVNSPSFLGRLRSVSASGHPTAGSAGPDARPGNNEADASRPNLQERDANSWGATTVNKKLRNEVFNDAFLKQPIAIRRHRKGHQRVPRRTLQQSLRPTGSDPSLIESHEKQSQSAVPTPAHVNGGSHAHTQSDVGQAPEFCDDDDVPPDVTGTSAPEPEILGESSPAQKKKRRYSGTGLRRKPKDVQDGRGNLQYFEEADDAKYKDDRADPTPNGHPKPMEVFRASPESEPAREAGAAEHRALTPAPPPAAPLEYSKIPRPVNPKEAQTQRDSRVEYFLLLEDLTAGMKRPCIMDLKMGTRQYGVDASPKKQKSQQGKCAKTTSRELGVRVCGLQVWNVQTQSYVFKDKYYGRELKRGPEFQAALTRFLYDGVDRASILRHIPTVLQKLDELEVIIKRLRGYRFYAASLLMFYDGDTSTDTNTNNNNHYVEDSTTDFATDTEEAPRRTRKNPREIDFKMADFANCVTAGDLSARDRPCPPRHPDEPDRGFLRGLRSLRRYFLRIQRDTRAEMGLACQTRNGNGNGSKYEEIDTDTDEDEGSVSE